MSLNQKRLAGKVAVVTGATRHAGRGIAIELGIAGATVYCTGRSVRGKPSPRNEPGTIEETAEMVDAGGGQGVWVQVDHTIPGEVEALLDRVMGEQGRLDLLVNNVSDGGGAGTSFLQTDLEAGLQQIVSGGHSHIIATHSAARRMAQAGRGLIISINDHEWDPPFYAMEKALINRLTISVADELSPRGVAVISLHPGAFFQCFDIMTEEALRAAVARDPAVAKCHTPRLIGRAVVALASDPAVFQKTGKLVKMRDLVNEYGLTDIDGRLTAGGPASIGETRGARVWSRLRVPHQSSVTQATAYSGISARSSRCLKARTMSRLGTPAASSSSAMPSSVPSF